jgi:hypothetical protein
LNAAAASVEGRFQRVREFLFGINDAHAATTATARRFYDHRIANLFGELRGFFGDSIAPRCRKNRNAGRFHRVSRGHLFTHQLE